MAKDPPHWFDHINPDDKRSRTQGMRLVGMMRGMVTLLRDPTTGEHFLYIYDTLIAQGDRETMRELYRRYDV